MRRDRYAAAMADGKSKRWAGYLVILAVLAVAGCGVKGDPAKPEGSTFPQEYPAPEALEPLDATPATGRTVPRRDATGRYVPPPPATQMR